MKYTEKMKQLRVRVVSGREVWYRDTFAGRDVLAGNVASRQQPGAKSPGGMVTDVVWVATTAAGQTQEFPSMTLAIESLLPKGT